MRKVFAGLVIGMMCLGTLAGCGDEEETKVSETKSRYEEEQAAMEEIAQHLIDEAAADGVDLMQEIQSEMEAYETREANNYQATMESLREENRKVQEERSEFTEDEQVKLINYLKSFLLAKTADEAERSASAYNEVMDSLAGKYSEKFMKEHMPVIRSNNRFPEKIDDSAVTLKKMYLENVDGEYKMFQLIRTYDDSLAPVYVFFNRAEFTAPISDIKICTLDGTVTVFDLRSYESEASYMTIDDYTGSHLYITRHNFAGDPLLVMELDIRTGEINEIWDEFEQSFNMTGSEFEFADLDEEREEYAMRQLLTY